jgi:hypothetical protein
MEVIQPKRIKDAPELDIMDDVVLEGNDGIEYEDDE